MSLSPRRVIPVLRIFSIEKAREFYVDWLGFAVDWEHRFGPDMPLYLQISRDGLVLHLSEHHGDGSPGAVVFLDVTGLHDFHGEIMAKGYRYLRPGIERQPWGSDEMTLTDPFGNRLRLNQFDKAS